MDNRAPTRKPPMAALSKPKLWHYQPSHGPGKTGLFADKTSDRGLSFFDIAIQLNSGIKHVL